MDTKSIQSISDKLRHRNRDRAEIMRELDPKVQAEVILHLGKHLQYEVMTDLTTDEVALLVNHLDPDDATDLLQLLPQRRRDTIIRSLDNQLTEDVSHLLPFDPDTAAGLMVLDYIVIKQDASIAEVAKQFKTHEKRTGRLPTIIQTTKGKVSGYLPVHELGFALPSEKVKKYRRRILTIKHDAKSSEVIDLFHTHPHDKAVVVGETGEVLGIIYSDDVLRLLREQESASLYDFAGLHAEEEVNDSAKLKIKSRYKWLIINLGTAFLASFTVGLFDKIIAQYVLLAVYMPIVAGMGGNAATQTLAVLVRGIALRQITLKTAWRALRNEVGAAIANGIINGIIVALVVLFLNHDVKIAIILAMAMIINLLIAAVFGTMVPLIMKALRKDPAASATIFITTATDVFGFMAFLGLATLILK